MNGFTQNTQSIQINGMNEENGRLKNQNKTNFTQYMAYEECKKGQYHSGEVLNCVCIDEKCTQNELICSVCEQEEHSDHLVIPLKVFLDSIQNIDKDKNSSDLLENNNKQNGNEKQLSESVNTLFGTQVDTKVNESNLGNIKIKNTHSSNGNSNVGSKDSFAVYLDEIDRQHQISLKYFQDYQTKINEGFNECINKINQFYKGVKNEIKHKQHLEDTCLQKVVQSLQKYQQNNQQVYQPNSSIVSQDTKQEEQKKVISNLGQSIKELLEIIGFNQDQGFKSFYKLDLNYVVQLCEQRHQKLILGKEADALLTQVKALTTKSSELYNEIPSLSREGCNSVALIPLAISTFLKLLRFSDKLKGDSITIKSPTIALQTQNESSGQRFCILDPCMSLNSRMRWGFKVKHLVGWVGIGICLVDIIKSFAYQFKYSKIGHGSYLLSGNGYTWSHSKNNQNSQNKSFHFVTGDTVYIEFDPLEKKVKFLKGKTLDQYQLEIDFVSTDQFAPCINLCSNGDEVEIINNEAELLSLNFQ